MPKKLTQEQAVEKINNSLCGSNLSFVDFADGVYVNARRKVLVDCIKHGRLSISFDKLKSGTRCKLCCNEMLSKLKRTDQSTAILRIKKSCDSLGLKFVSLCDELFISVDHKAVIECHVHGQFKRRIADINSKKYGCPTCSINSVRDMHRMPEPEVIERWGAACRSKGLVFIGLASEYESADKTRGNISCEKHGSWSVGYSNFVLGNGGCPACSSHGFNGISEAFVYALISEHGVKVGISNSPKGRIRTLKARTPFNFSVSHIVRLHSGEKARQIERVIHKEFKSLGLSGFDGATEWLELNDKIIPRLMELSST